jgi:hypothetical protein
MGAHQPQVELFSYIVKLEKRCAWIICCGASPGRLTSLSFALKSQRLRSQCHVLLFFKHSLKKIEKAPTVSSRGLCG